MSVPFVDIHTHHHRSNALSIFNAKNMEDVMVANSKVSVGIHPWYIDLKSVETSLIKLKSLVRNEKVVAIGECGLDRLTNVDMNLQKEILKKQMKLSLEVNKPLIVHCVRAFDEIIQMKLELNYTLPIIIHGYNNNAIIANRLLKNGFYLSFGKAIMNENSNASKIISTIPIEKLFLETDDSEISIEDIYNAAAKCINVEPELLKINIYKNYNRVFTHE